MSNSNDPLNVKPDDPKAEGANSSPEFVEDSGSRALAEALRSSFVIVKIIMIILVVVFFSSGFFTVSSKERAIVLRFGRPLGMGDQQLLGPGAHWSFPYPVDEIVKIPFSEFQTVRSTTGWYATTPEMEASGTEPYAGQFLNPAADGYTLTSDTNIIHLRATLRYRIHKPLDYALNFVSASNLVQNALNNALFYSSVRFTVDEALRLKILVLKEQISSRVQTIVDKQQLGVTVEQVDLQSIAPRYLQPAFAAVLSAEQESRQTNEVAVTYANRAQSSAQGEANSLINAGETARSRLVQTIAAEARYFTDQLPYYERNPKLFMDRLRSEAILRILTNSAVEKFFIPEGQEGQVRELRTLLSREPQKPSRQP
ncbi:MAG: protease modulator HflK [Verrucomicrobia bacterium]|nr:protease modulator HflK [Verrucomicrobiota bacterium]